MDQLKLFWNSIRSNPYFVAFEGGVSGALMNYLYDELGAGRLDFSAAGLKKLAAFCVLGGVTAVRLLRRPQTVPTIVATVPPSNKITDVPATLVPADPNAVPAQPTIPTKPLIVLAFAAVLLPLGITTMGCATATAPTPPLAPGYSNPADQTMGQTLAAAHSFYEKVQKNAEAGTMILSAPEKAAMNDLATAINVAQTTYLAYHSGTVTQAQAQATVDAMTAKQTAAETLIPGVK